MAQDDVVAAVVGAFDVLCWHSEEGRLQDVIPRLSTAALLLYAGDFVAVDKELRDRAAALLEAGNPLPPNLSAYIAVRLRNGCTPIKERRHWATGRDIRISLAVRHVMTMGFLPYRNEATRDAERGESACSIVATALGRLGVAIGEHAVVKIWGNTARACERRHVPDLLVVLEKLEDLRGDR